jgi:serine/threonine protein kinase
MELASCTLYDVIHEDIAPPGTGYRVRTSQARGNGVGGGSNELSVGWKLSAIYDIAKAVRYLHTNGILHRDIKPKNCLVSLETNRFGYATIKLGDFGLAKSAVLIESYYLLT